MHPGSLKKASKTSISLGTFSHLFNAMCRGFALKGCNFGGRSAQHHASGSSKRVLNNIGLRTGWNVVGFRFVPCSYSVRTVFVPCSYSVRTCSYRVRTMFVHARTRFEQCSGWTPIIRVPNYEGLDCNRKINEKWPIFKVTDLREFSLSDSSSFAQIDSFHM